MYHWIEDKEYISHLKSFSGSLMQEICHELKEEYDIGATFYLVGSGARNLILQNESEPIDLDYNLEIVRCGYLKDAKMLKDNAMKVCDRVLRRHGLSNCDDSTSSITTKKIYFGRDYHQVYSEFGRMFSNQIPFQLDICITRQDRDGTYQRLIHNKTGRVDLDQYYWNTAPNSKKLRQKVKIIKDKGKWLLVRNEYFKLKNYYLSKNDHNHPSFICYIEAVNNVYNSIKNQK